NPSAVPAPLIHSRCARITRDGSQPLGIAAEYVDAEQPVALLDRRLEHIGIGTLESGPLELIGQTAGDMPGHLAHLGRQWTAGHEGTDARHDDGHGGQYVTAEFTEPGSLHRVFDLDARRGVEG